MKERKVKVNLEWAKLEKDYFWTKAHREITTLARIYFNLKLSTQAPTVLEFLKLGKTLMINVDLPSGESTFYFLEWNNNEEGVLIRNTRSVKTTLIRSESIVSDLFSVLARELLDYSDLDTVIHEIKEFIDKLIEELEKLEKQLEPLKENIEKICKTSELWVENSENYHLRGNMFIRK